MGGEKVVCLVGSGAQNPSPDRRGVMGEKVPREGVEGSCGGFKRRGVRELRFSQFLRTARTSTCGI